MPPHDRPPWRRLRRRRISLAAVHDCRRHSWRSDRECVAAFRWQSLGRLNKVDRYLRHLGPRRFHRLWRLLDPRHIRSAPSTTLNTLQEIHCAPIWIATPPLLREESDFEEQSSHPRSRVWRYRPACRLTNASGCSSRSSTRYKWRSAGMLLGEDLADRALRHGKPNMGSWPCWPGGVSARCFAPVATQWPFLKVRRGDIDDRQAIFHAALLSSIDR